MVVSEHRLKRMIRIVDMMRKQQYPNYTKIRRAFEQATLIRQKPWFLLVIEKQSGRI